MDIIQPKGAGTPVFIVGQKGVVCITTENDKFVVRGPHPSKDAFTEVVGVTLSLTAALSIGENEVLRVDDRPSVPLEGGLIAA